MQDVNVIIAENTGLVYKQLYRYHLVGDPEAESAAFWALYRAITTYNEDAHTLLSTYATCCIYNALGDYVRKLKRKKRIQALSYNVEIFDDTEFEEILTDGILLEDVVVQDELVRKTREVIAEILNKMTNPVQLQIVKIYVMNNYNVQETAIAKQIGKSQSYVSQVLAEFRGKLKKKMGGYYHE
jgi:RNA polymerase sigma factor (sigma-70 family)